jgi:hypothetical protein
MKFRLLMLLTCLGSLPVASHANGALDAISGDGTETCPQMLESFNSAKRHFDHDIAVWSIGYVLGLNAEALRAHRPNHRFPPVQQMVADSLFMFRWCQTHPNSMAQDAAFAWWKSYPVYSPPAVYVP